jgi:hypothetical protein
VTPARAVRGPAFALALGASVVVAEDARAQAQPPGKAAECVAATERGQAKRDEGQLVASRAEFLACGGESCPAVVRRECVRWLAEVDARIPTLVVSVADSNGKDVAAAEVSLDGVRLPAAGLGRAFSLDPGPHVLRVTGKKVDPIEERIVVRERERERVVKLVLRSLEPPPARPASGLVTVPRKRTVPALSWVLGGVAVLGGAGFAYFWARGMNEVSDLRGSCSPYCTASQIDDARSPLTVARISGGVGIAAALAAVTVYFLQPTTTTQPASSAAAPGTWAVSF